MIKENLPIYIKRVILSFIIVLSAVLQNTPNVLPKMFSSSAMLLIPVVVSVSMFESEIVSMVFGILAGMLWDFTGVSGNYFHTIILCVSAFFISMLIRRRVRNTLLSSMILTFLVTFLHNTLYCLFYVFIPSYEGAAAVYFNFYMLSCIYTVIIGIFVYLIIKPIEKAFRV